MSVSWLPPSNLMVLRHLALYRFLTVPQLIRLGVAKHKPSVYKIIGRFKTLPRKLIEQKNFAFNPGRGNVHSVYYLTRQGAELLADVFGVDPSRIKYPRGQTIFEDDYFHRVATIDFHIAVRRQARKAGATITFFETYFDKTGSNRKKRSGDRLRARTRVGVGDRFFNADAIYHYVPPKQQGMLAVFEMHNGRDTGRFMRQLSLRIDALEAGSINEKYQISDPCILQCVFEHESTMNAVIRRLQQQPDLEGFRDYVGLITIEEVRKDFSRSWRHF